MEVLTCVEKPRGGEGESEFEGVLGKDVWMRLSAGVTR